MQVNLLKTEYPLTKLTATAGDWSYKAYLGPFHRQYDVPIPEGIDVHDVEIVSEPCDEKGKVFSPAVVLKARTTVKKSVAPQPVAVESEPQPERKPKAKRKVRDQEIAQDERPIEQPMAAD